MGVTLPPSQSPYLDHSSWGTLIQNVADFEPTVVIPVARKMPRLLEYFKLDIQSRWTCFSDLAIPFAHQYIRGARVAIVDDVVNVGTTLINARSACLKCGASDVQLFAMCRQSNRANEGLTATLIVDEPLTDVQYDTFCRQVPRALQSLPKPYDLDFAMCRVAIPLPRFRIEDLRTSLAETGVNAACREVSDYRSTVYRVSIDLAGGSPSIRKVRLYIDRRSGTGHAVAMDIPQGLTSAALAPRSLGGQKLAQLWGGQLAECPAELSDWLPEARSRLALFIRSAELLAEFLLVSGARIKGLGEHAISDTDSGILFGPVASSIPWPLHEFLPSTPDRQNGSVAQTPFLEGFATHQKISFEDLIRRELKSRGIEARDLMAAFPVIFDLLATLIGASDPDSYALDWPIPKSDIIENPYLRLKIGLTFGDLAELFALLIHCPSPERLRLNRDLSFVLDSYVDAGTIVPTFVSFDKRGPMWRGYRKGESSERDRQLDRIQFAMSAIAGKVSHTRISKIGAILAFSREFQEILQPKEMERGYVGALIGGPLDLSDLDAFSVLRDRGRAKRN